MDTHKSHIDYRIRFSCHYASSAVHVGLRVTSTASLADGHCEATIPVVKGRHVTMGVSRETALA